MLNKIYVIGEKIHGYSKMDYRSEQLQAIEEKRQ